MFSNFNFNHLPSSLSTAPTPLMDSYSHIDDQFYWSSDPAHPITRRFLSDVQTDAQNVTVDDDSPIHKMAVLLTFQWQMMTDERFDAYIRQVQV